MIFISTEVITWLSTQALPLFVALKSVVKAINTDIMPARREPTEESVC